MVDQVRGRWVLGWETWTKVANPTPPPGQRLFRPPSREVKILPASYGPLQVLITNGHQRMVRSVPFLPRVLRGGQYLYTKISFPLQCPDKAMVFHDRLIGGLGLNGISLAFSPPDARP